MVVLSFVPMLSPSISFVLNHCAERREGESLGGFDYVLTLMACSLSILSNIESKEQSLDQRASRFFGVLYRWLD